ncbi:hypothetical protein Cpir12675_004055 [Ceratocystis pirilliformis]|uniref:Glycoside hydrolase family 5 domain-containing protein n=1 Tax=Ceratocystis pirilliformis TaxID=259994 RepID=A0ABR3Z087_9PEZI
MAVKFIANWLFGEVKPEERVLNTESHADLSPPPSPTIPDHIPSRPFIEPKMMSVKNNPGFATWPDLSPNAIQDPHGQGIQQRTRTFTEQSPLLSHSSALSEGVASEDHSSANTIIKGHILQFPSIRRVFILAVRRVLHALVVVIRSIAHHPIISFIVFVALTSSILVLRIIFPPKPNIATPWMPEYVGRHNFTIPPYQPEFLATSYSLPLRTSGRNVVDQQGRRFKVAAVNWYGASDELFVPGGLDIRHRSKIATLIRDLGFNTVRLPYSDELVRTNPVIPARHIAANPDLIGLRALDVFHATVHALVGSGIAVIINNHITQARWCCDADPCDAGWSNSHLGSICPVRQTTHDWITHWTDIMRPLANEPLVLGADLRNEVRGLWGTMPWPSWAAAAEEVAENLLAINPQWLMVVEGTSSANDLTGVATRPITLSVPNRLVYSAHVYSWSGWGSLKGRYSLRKYESFANDMHTNWGYLITENVAPVWVGEVGAPMDPDKGDANYWRNLMQYLRDTDADFGYWAINPRKPHEDMQESYGLIEDDWQTVVKDYRLRDMLQLMNVNIDDWE